MAWSTFRTWVPGEFELAAFQLHALGQLEDSLVRRGERLASLVGPFGVGKTVIAGRFAQQNRRTFPNQLLLTGHADADWVEAGSYANAEEGAALYVIDEADRIPADRLAGLIRTAQQSVPDLHLLLIGTSSFELAEQTASEVRLEGTFTPQEVASYLGLELSKFERSRLSQWLSGRQLTPREIGTAIQAGVILGDQRGIEIFDQDALITADGQPVSSSKLAEAHMHVQSASARLYELIAKDPHLLRALEPREFEEVIAEYFRRRGFDVTLTAQSRDGGKDIYAATKTELGSFLYVVECKAHAPDNPVGVGLVRHLYGVVQHERATVGILATTSYFTGPALAFEGDVPSHLSLRDFNNVANWLRRGN